MEITTLGRWSDNLQGKWMRQAHIPDETVDDDVDLKQPRATVKDMIGLLIVGMLGSRSHRQQDNNVKVEDCRWVRLEQDRDGWHKLRAVYLRI